MKIFEEIFFCKVTRQVTHWQNFSATILFNQANVLRRSEIMVNLKKISAATENQITIYAPQKKFCTNCGAEVEAQDNFCRQCGKEIDNLPPPPTPQNFKNKWIALLLCIFLGFLGAHKFYEGQIFMGIIYVAVFAVFVIFENIFGFFIVVLMDFIEILFKKNIYYVD